MSTVKFYRGNKASYNEESYKDGIYFASDTQEIYLNGTAYGVSTELASQIESLSGEITSLQESSKVSVTETTDVDEYLKSYNISQGGSTLGTINIPKDLVVASGEIVQATTDNPITYNGTEYKDGESFLKLSISNQDTPVYILVSDLVDVYTGSTGSKISVTISNKNKVSADIVSGSIAKTDLASDVQTSLDNADKSVQSITSTEDGKITYTTASNSSTSVEIKGFSDLQSAVETLEGEYGNSSSTVVEGASGNTHVTVSSSTSGTTTTYTINENDIASKASLAEVETAITWVEV